MPKKWYNLASDLTIPRFLLGPDAAGNPEMMSAIFPMSAIEQEMTTRPK